MKKNKENQWPHWREALMFVGAILILVKLITNASNIFHEVKSFMNVLSPFIFGTIMAYFLSRPTSKLELLFKKTKKTFFAKRARGFSVLTIFLGSIGIIALIISFGLPIIISNLIDFANQIIVYYESLQSFFNNVEPNSWLAEFVNSDFVVGINESLSFDRIIMQLSNSAMSIVESLLLMTSGVINTVISLIFCIYMLLSKESVLGLINRIATIFIKPPILKSIKFYLNKSNDIFYQFISAQFIDACILGTISMIMLSFLGVKYAITLGLLLGVCNMIPYFGSMFASFLTSTITLFTGGIELALLTGVCLLILQQIDGNFIGPTIMGDKLDLNPMLVILSITVGGAYFGIIGMFISVPIAAMLKLFLNDFLTLEEKRKNLIKNTETTDN